MRAITLVGGQVIVAIAMSLLLAHSAMAMSRETYNFNSDWRLHVGDVPGAEAVEFDDKDWKPVTLPHAFNEDSAFKEDIDDLPNGVAWYRKTFDAPDGLADKKVFLEFQGVRQAAEVFINGKSAVLSENGVMAFGADVTPLLKSGKNIVAVRCDSSYSYHSKIDKSGFQWNDKNFYANYGGLNKNVLMHVTDKLYQTLPLYSTLGTTGIYVYAIDVNVPDQSATVNIESQVKNERAQSEQVTLEVAIADRDGKEVARFDCPATEIKAGEMMTLKASGKAANLNFWSWGYGYLYDVKTTLKVDGKAVDSVITRTGFRKTEFANGALKLNDRTLQVHGYAQRTTNEWPALGTDVPPWVSDFSNGLMVASNANLVRWMHVTPSKQDVESCDRVGLIEAMPAGDAEGDVTGKRWEARVALMRDSIIYNRNNPSIIFYEAGNKGINEDHIKEMVALKQQFDPHGGRAMGAREMLGSDTAEYGGEMLYINKSAGKPLWQMEYSRDESARKYMDDQTPPYHKDGDGPMHRGESAASYNRNQDSMVAETVARWYDYWHERPGTGRRVNGGGVNIIFSDSNTHHRGALNYRTSGEVDAMRVLKEGFFANQIMWNGWVDIEHVAAHIVGHWNYPAGTKKDIQVVSSADKVELLLNGKKIGDGQQSSRFLFTFPNIAYEPGTLTAVGYDLAGKKVCETELQTAGDPVALRLTPHTDPTGFKADGSDLALVDVEVVDAQGRRCPTAFDLIDFKLDGPAEWRGGIAIGPDNYILAKSLPVELGVNRVGIRSTPEAGTITLTASSGKLKQATLTLETKPQSTTGGISSVLPGADLVASLSRGPTPAGDSIHPTRTTLAVADVTAGSNAEDAKASMDDNESTSWTSKGKPEEAWIRYTLAAPTAVSEITLKMSAWRTKSYPIIISVDDQVVFKGLTPQSLGYITIPIKPTVGKSVTIRLAGKVTDKDVFDLTEVTGKKQAEGAKDVKVGKDALGIVEVELYGPLVSNTR